MFRDNDNRFVVGSDISLTGNENAYDITGTLQINAVDNSAIAEMTPELNDVIIDVRQ